MAAQSQKDDAEVAESGEYPKAKRENGMFVIPWSTPGLPSALNAMKWFMTSPNDSNLPTSFYSYDNKVWY